VTTLQRRRRRRREDGNAACLLVLAAPFLCARVTKAHLLQMSGGRRLCDGRCACNAACTSSSSSTRESRHRHPAKCRFGRTDQTGPCGHPETGKGHFSGCTFRTLEPEYCGHMSLFSCDLRFPVRSQHRRKWGFVWMEKSYGIRSTASKYSVFGARETSTSPLLDHFFYKLTHLFFSAVLMLFLDSNPVYLLTFVMHQPRVPFDSPLHDLDD
jgi:hypothetical protein